MIQIMEYLRNFGIIKCGHCHNLLLLLLLFLMLCLPFRTTIQIRQLNLVRRLCMCEWKSLLYVGQTFAHNIQSWIVLPEMPYCFNLASSPFSPNSVCAFVSKTITNLMYIIPYIQSDSTETRSAMIISDNYKLNKLMNKNKVHVLTRQLYNRFLFESSFLPKNKYAWDLLSEYVCLCPYTHSDVKNGDCNCMWNVSIVCTFQKYIRIFVENGLNHFVNWKVEILFFWTEV